MSESVIWTTTNGIHSPQVAELVLTLMLALARKLPLMFKLQEKGEWCNARHEVLMPRELRQATAGIIGYGNIGRQVGYLCRAFGMRVIAADRKEVLEREPAWKLPGLASPADAMPDKLFDPSDITPLLQESDYVVLCVPATPQTIGLINDRALASMKASCVLINVARGGVVDEDALVEALRSHRIGGAALDVFAKEPLPPSSPLWKLPNMIITHHVAGLSPYYLERSMTLFAENLRRYVAGEQLLNVVDRVRGY
jgi:phosphoglycerate dehydrogenase-like enzyme